MPASLAAKIKWWHVLIVCICALPFALASAVGGAPPASAWLDAPGWSRARLVGATHLDRAPLAVDDAGGIYLFLARRERGALRPLVVALDRRAARVWERTLDIALDDPGQPQIHWDGAGLTLLWLSDGRLYAARLAPDGSERAAPAVVSGAVEVDSYAAAIAPDGRLAVWYGGPPRAPGVYALPPGDLAAPAALVDPQGVLPSVRFDAAGALHAIWGVLTPARRLAISYGAYPGGRVAPGVARAVAEIDGPSATLDVEGPVFGIDGERGYLMWTTFAKAGMNTGSSLARYISFPLDDPGQASAAQPVAVPVERDLPYLPGAGALAAGPRVALGERGVTGSSAPSSMIANPAVAPELAVVSTATGRLRAGDARHQVGVLFFGGGAPTGYQLLSVGQRSALTPALVSDGDHQLYVTWREISSASADVYLASTAPDMRQALGALSGDDLVRLAAAVVFGMITGVILAPFTGLMLLVAPLLVLALTWGLRRSDARHTQPGTLVSLGAGLAAYWGARLLLLSRVAALVPFVEWVPFIPPWLELPLRIGTPLAIALLALRAAWGLTYGAGRRSAALFVLIYGAIDSVATMAIYGEQLFG